ncbi:hypothetical protein U1Q18_001026 [Sarracenia purpurea var. burkii]
MDQPLLQSSIQGLKGIPANHGLARVFGVTDIAVAEHRNQWLQLECTACGNMSIDGPNSARSVGTAPWATAKFEDVEKKLVSPRETERAAGDVFKKTTKAYMPVLDTQKSFNKPRTEDNNTAITRDPEQS